MRIDDLKQEADLDLKKVRAMEILGKSLIIGILTGLVISGYRLLGSQLGDLFKSVYLLVLPRAPVFCPSGLGPGGPSRLGGLYGPKGTHDFRVWDSPNGGDSP